MNRKTVFGLISLLGVVLMFNGCAVPRVLWPQEDLPSSQSMGKPGGPTVIVASRNSAFKKALVKELSQTMQSMGVTQRTIGVSGLENIDASQYDAVVVISSCIAWGLEREVQLFLERQNKNSNIILVTTSGEGGWLPNNIDHDIDAISSASTLTTVDAVTRDVIAQINSRLPIK